MRTISYMKQIGTAFHLFSADNRMIMPGYRPYGSSSSEAYPSGSYSKAFWTSWIQPYLNSTWLSLADPIHVRLWGEIPDSYGYGMNSSLPNPFWFVNDVEVPSATMLIGTIGVNAPESKSRITANTIHRDPSQMGFHHNGYALVLYVDGRVEQLRPEDIPPWEARVGNHQYNTQYRNFWRGGNPQGVSLRNTVGPSHPRLFE